MSSVLQKGELLRLQKELLSILESSSNRCQFSSFRKDMMIILNKFKKSARDNNILDENDNYFENLTIILSHYIELEITGLNHDEATEAEMCSSEIFENIQYFCDAGEYNFLRTFMHYFLRNFDNVHENAALFCRIFERQFLPFRRVNKATENKLEFFAYLFIFKIWHHVSRTADEKQKIIQLVPHLYKYESDLPSFIVSKKYVTDAFYGNDTNVIKSLRDKIIAILKSKDDAEDQMDIFSIKSSYSVPVQWMQQLGNPNDVIFISDDSFCDVHLEFSEINTISNTQSYRENSEDSLESSSIGVYLSDSSEEVQSLSSKETPQLSQVDSDKSIKKQSSYLFSVQRTRFKSKSSPEWKLSIKLNNVNNGIGIIERYDYLPAENNKDSFKEYRRKQLQIRKSKNKHVPGQWQLVNQCFVKLKKLDPLDVNGFYNKNLSMEYMDVTYSSYGGSHDEDLYRMMSSVSIGSTKSIEIREEANYSRRYLYCREVDSSL